jgi:hypothetical protein
LEYPDHQHNAVVRANALKDPAEIRPQRRNAKLHRGRNLFVLAAL